MQKHSITIFLAEGLPHGKIYSYVIGVLGRHFGLHFVWVGNAEEAEINLDSLAASQSHCPAFYGACGQQPWPRMPWQKWLDPSGYIVGDGGKPDLVATIFYKLNCLQEMGCAAVDGYDRFPFAASWQAAMGLAEVDVVSGHLQDLAQICGLPTGGGPANAASTVFLSHDIDWMHNAWKHDGKWALRRGRIDILARLVICQYFARPHWFNTDRIMDMHSERGLISTFFWLVQKGDSEIVGIKNADYDITKPNKHRILSRVQGRGFANGLHKAVAPTTHREELARLGTPVVANRNHYLHLHLPSHWEAIEAAGIAVDASLGFAEAMGHRNGYGLPFSPYNFATGRAYSLVSVPLQVMDNTFLSYRNLPSTKVASATIQFLEGHKKGAVISLLWHNNFLSDHSFRGYKKAYETILDYIEEQKMETLLPQQLVSRFGVGH